MRGVHRTIEQWYGCTQRTSGITGDWIDRFNLARGSAIAADLSRWMKAGSPLTGSAFSAFKTQTRAIILAVQARGWKIVGVEIPVVCRIARAATAVDLIVATSPPVHAGSKWKPSKTDPVAICEIKLIGDKLWNAPSGPMIPGSICGGTPHPATPRLVAFIQLAFTHVLYSSTYVGQLQHCPVLIHVSPSTQGMSCQIEVMPKWVFMYVIPDIRRRLSSNDHQRANEGEGADS